MIVKPLLYIARQSIWGKSQYERDRILFARFLLLIAIVCLLLTAIVLVYLVIEAVS